MGQVLSEDYPWDHIPFHGSHIEHTDTEPEYRFQDPHSKRVLLIDVLERDRKRVVNVWLAKHIKNEGFFALKDEDLITQVKIELKKRELTDEEKFNLARNAGVFLLSIIEGTK